MQQLKKQQIQAINFNCSSNNNNKRDLALVAIIIIFFLPKFSLFLNVDTNSMQRFFSILFLFLAFNCFSQQYKVNLTVPGTIENENGELLHQGSFQNGFALVKKVGLYGIIDTTGHLVMHPRYKEAPWAELEDLRSGNFSKLLSNDIKLTVIDSIKDTVYTAAARYDTPPHYFSGIWQLHNKGGKLIAKLNYKNGKAEGQWQEEHDSGQVASQGLYLNGKKEGEWIEKYKNGQLRKKEFFINGKQEGESAEYYENADLLKKGIYKEGKEEGEWAEYYDNKQLREKGKYVAGNEEGEWLYYHENGQPGGKGVYRGGKKEGLWVFYHENGNASVKENYLVGNLEGEWMSFDENGQMLEKKFYKEGVEQSGDGEKK